MTPWMRSVSFFMRPRKSCCASGSRSPPSSRSSKPRSAASGLPTSCASPAARRPTLARRSLRMTWSRASRSRSVVRVSSSTLSRSASSSPRRRAVIVCTAPPSSSSSRVPVRGTSRRKRTAGDPLARQHQPVERPHDEPGHRGVQKDQQRQREERRGTSRSGAAAPGASPVRGVLRDGSAPRRCSRRRSRTRTGIVKPPSASGCTRSITVLVQRRGAGSTDVPTVACPWVRHREPVDARASLRMSRSSASGRASAQARRPIVHRRSPPTARW